MILPHRPTVKATVGTIHREKSASGDLGSTQCAFFSPPPSTPELSFHCERRPVRPACVRLTIYMTIIQINKAIILLCFHHITVPIGSVERKEGARLVEPSCQALRPSGPRTSTTRVGALRRPARQSSAAVHTAGRLSEESAGRVHPAYPPLPLQKDLWRGTDRPTSSRQLIACDPSCCARFRGCWMPVCSALRLMNRLSGVAVPASSHDGRLVPSLRAGCEWRLSDRMSDAGVSALFAEWVIS